MYKRTKQSTKRPKRRMKQFLGFLLSVALLLSDASIAYAMEGSVSGGDVTVESSDEAENGTDVVSENDTENGTETGTKTETGIETEIGTENGTEIENESGAGDAPVDETVTVPETGAETETGTETESVPGAGAETEPEEETGDTTDEDTSTDTESDMEGDVSGGDAGDVSGGDAGDVSGGDALTIREPEHFYEEEKPENYGTLVTYDTYSRTYHVEGDKYVTVVGNDGATYIDESGALQEVDNTLVENPVATFGRFGSTPTTYVNTANDYTVMLPESLAMPGWLTGVGTEEAGDDADADTSSEGSGITIINGDYLMTMYPAEGTFENGIIRDNAIRYSNVFAGIDYQYTVLGNSIKEDIILLEKTDKNSFSYYLDTYGLTAVLENNVLYLCEETDATGNTGSGTGTTGAAQNAIFVLEAPEMEDAAGEVSFGVNLSVAEAEGMYLVTVTADNTWLQAEERVYPVRIDPTAVQVTGSAIRIACAEEGSPNTVIGDNQYPYVGYDDGVTSGNYAGYGSRHLNCRSYFAIDYDFSALGADAEIVSATFSVTQRTRWSKGTSEFGLFGVAEDWQVNSLTWNNQVAYNHYFLDSAYASTTRGEALSFDVTEEVSAWINGTADNHGFVMKAMTEAPNAEAAASGVKMQCEVFYNNSSASYAPKLVLSWTGELTDLESMGLDDTTIEIYPVVERNGDKSTNTLGVVAHGLAKAGSTVHYSLIDAQTGETVAEETLVYPDSAAYAGSFPTALSYNRRLSNWQSEVFLNLVPGQVYYISAYAEGVVNDTTDPEAEPVYGVGKTVTSEPFIIYEEGAFDLIPRIALHYGVDVNTIMADMQMQDALTKEGNRLFIRNPQNTAPYVAGEMSDYMKAMIDGLLMGRAEHCEFGFEPINLNTGNFYMEQTDATLTDIGGAFAFTRQYNAKGAAYKGIFGYGWSTPFDERLGELADGSVLWISGTGSIITFTKTADGYKAPAGYDVTLTDNGDSYVIINADTGEKHIFNGYGMLTAMEDIYGNRTTLSYDMEYRLASVTSPSGKKYTVSLDGENRISAIGLPDGSVITYSYDGAGNLVKVTDEAGDTITFTYNAAHRMLSWTDENGHVVITNTYDEEGRVIKQVDAEGGVVTLSYSEGKTTTTDANGNETVYEYDENFRTTQIEYPDGSTETRTYNGAGYLESITDRQGVTTTYTYDGAGRVIGETRADGAKRSFTYTSAGQVSTVTGFDGMVTTYTYDEKNRLTSVKEAGGGASATTGYTYDTLNRLVSMTDAEGNTTTYTYEGACVVSATDAEGNVWKYTYDEMNRELTATDPLGNTTSKTYDVKGRCIKETDGEGNTTIYTFDDAGCVIAITDKEGQKSTFTYDKLNRMLSGKDPLGNTLSYTYDGNGNKLTEQDASASAGGTGGVTTYVYDAMNRLVKETDAEGCTTTYTYDRADRVVSITNGRGNTSLLSFDAVKGCLISETNERGGKTVYETDICGRTTKVIYPDGSTISYTYDGLGRMVSVTDKLGTTTHLTYDKVGNPISLSDDETRVYAYTYDACNRLVKTTDPLGGTVAYAYDGAGNVVSTTDENGNTTTYTYDGAGRVTAITDAEGGCTLYTYDKEGRLVSETTPEGRKTVYTYDAIGQLVERMAGISGGDTADGNGTTDAEGTGILTTYTYDGLSRLTGVSDSAGTLATYTYDKVGNLTTMTDALCNAHSYQADALGNLTADTYPNGEKETYTYLATGEVAAFTDRYGVESKYTYDSLGRVAEAGDSTGRWMSYEYDAAGNLVKQTDVLGRSTLYTYDAFGRLITVTEVDGAVTTYTYDALDRLVASTDAAGNTTTYTYDKAGNLLTVTEPGEAVTTYWYDALNRLISVTDPEGAVTTYAYDKDSNLTTATDGNGIANIYAYDALSRLVSFTDGNGGKTLYTYDVRNNLTALTTPEGITERYGYDAAGNILTITNGMGETTHYEYDNLYRLVQQTSPLGAVESYTYDAHDIVTNVTDPLGAVTAYKVNAAGLVTSITQPNGGVYSYTYDAAERLTGITTPLGYEKTFTYSVGNDIIRETDNLDRTTTYAYDVLHNLTTVTDAEGGVTSYTYDGRSNLVTMTNALGNTYSYGYDRADRMVTVTDPEEKAASVVYDAVGNIASLTTPGNRTTGYTYDGNYNVTAVTDPMGYVYGYSYDRNDRLTGTIDPLSQTTAYGYDAADRLVSYTDKMGLSESYTYDAGGRAVTYTATDGLVTAYTYDAKDRLTSVTDPQGSVAYYNWDVMGNLTGVTDYLGRGTTYTYDLEGNLTSITDATGRTEQMTYDVAGRLLTYTSNGGNTISYDYDKLNNLVEKSYTDANGETSGESVVYAYNALGERVEMYDSTGDTVYTYDSLGRITSVTTYRTPGTDGSDFSHAESQGDTVTYTYDEADNLSAITYPDGTSVYYEYDLNDNIIKVTDREGLETTYVYDAINRITEIHRPNGISTYNTYNARNQITELKNICDDCEWVVSTYRYTYDDKGFIIAETAIESLAGYAYDEKHDGKHEDGKHDALYPHGNNHNGKHDKDATFAYQIVQVDRTFTYDDAGKLLSSTETEDNYGTYTYAYEYDLMGNRTAVVKTDENGDVAESRYYTYNESSQLVEVELYNGKKTTTVTYEYDADGNLISETGKDGTDKVELTYTYTVENRLEAVYDGKELLMAAAYDGDGNRVFQLNYNLHTDDDWKGNNGNGNGSNKDNSGSGNSSSSSSSSGAASSTVENTTVTDSTTEETTEDTEIIVLGDDKSNNGNGGNSSYKNGKGGNGKNNGNNGNNGNGNGNNGNGNGNSSSSDSSDDTTTDSSTENSTGTSDTVTDTETGNTTTDSTSSTGNGNATNAEENNSQNQCGILFPIASEVSDTEEYLISLIKTDGKEKNYELIEYINDVNREYAEVLVEQNINGADDTTYVYGAVIGNGADHLSLDRFDGSTGYYLYDPRGSVTGITNEEGQIYQSYRYSAFGEITFGAPEYENEYTYNGESYNPNIESQYLRARYYDVVTATFITEDFYPQDMWSLWNITEPLTLNRYNYCVSSPLNYVDPSGHWVYEEELAQVYEGYYSMSAGEKRVKGTPSARQMVTFLSALHELNRPNATVDFVLHFDYVGGGAYVSHVEKLAEQRNENYACEIIKQWVTLEMLENSNNGVNSDHINGWYFKEIISYDLATSLPEYGDKNGERVTQDDVDEINLILDKYGINTPNRIAHFLAQCEIESEHGLLPVERYKGDDIFAYFQKYEGEDNSFGNLAYGDGAKYRGGGAIQMTGRNAYAAFSVYMDDPRILEEGALYVAQNYYWESAAYYWSIYKPNTANDDRFNLNLKCDEGASVMKITGIIKGSSDNYEKRRTAYEYYIDILEE